MLVIHLNPHYMNKVIETIAGIIGVIIALFFIWAICGYPSFGEAVLPLGLFILGMGGLFIYECGKKTGVKEYLDIEKRYGKDAPPLFHL